MKRVGFTKIGFSRSSFGCCAHYTFCEMGRKVCFYKDIDPEVPLYCDAYQRHHQKGDILKTNEHVSTLSDNEVKLNEEDNGQLSLF